MRKIKFYINIFTLLLIISNNIYGVEYSERQKTFILNWEKNYDKKVTSIISSTDNKNSMIYVFSEDKDNSVIEAIYKEDGTRDWKSSCKSKIKSAPIIADEILFFGNNEGQIYALGASDGHEKWKNANKKAILTNPLFYQGRLYIGSWDGALYAFMSGSGKQLWKFKTKDVISNTPVIYDNIVFIGSLDGHIYALDMRDGKELWKKNTGWAGTYFSPVIDKRNASIIFADNDKNIYAMDPANGKEKWKFSVEWPGLYTEMVLIDNVLFVPSLDGNLYSVNPADGNLIWKLNLGKFFLVNPPTVNEKIFLATEHGELISLNISDGSVNWRYKIAERIIKRPILFDDMIFLASDQGYIYGLDTLFGDIIFQYVIDYYPDYLLYYDYNSESFYYFSHENKLLCFSKEKEDDISKEEIKIEDNIDIQDFLDAPTFSPDGKFFLYSDYSIKNDNNLYRAEKFDTTIKIIKLIKSTYDDKHPQWFCDSTGIIFTSDRDGSYNLYKMDLRKLDIYYYDAIESGECIAPANVTLEDLKNSTPEEMEKKYLTKLTQEEGDELYPQVSSSTSKVVYSSNGTGNLDLWIMDTSGANKFRLTYEPADEEHARFSPDGSKIAFVSSRLKDKDIFTINPDGTGMTQITQTDSDEINPEWINDTTIVYEKLSIDKKFSNICTIDKAGRVKAVTSGNYNDSYPMPSPDGKKIVFISDRKDNKKNIWLINNDDISGALGNIIIQITNFSSEVYPPSWSKDGRNIAFFIRDKNNERKFEIFDINSISIQEYFNQAENLIYQGSYAHAWQIYQQLIENYPNQKTMVFIEPAHFSLMSHMAALFKMAQIEELRKKHEQSLALWKMLIEDNASDYDEQKKFSLVAYIHIRLVEHMFKEGKHDEAIEYYKKILLDYPDMKNEFGYPLVPYINMRIAECYEKNKKYDQAINTYLKAQENYSRGTIMLGEDYIGTMALAFINIARIYDAQYEDYDRSLQYYLKVMENYFDDKFVDSKGVVRGLYKDKAILSIRRIYAQKKINFQNWITICTQAYETNKDIRVKKTVQLILNELDKIMKGEDLSKLKLENPKILFCSRKKTGDLASTNYEIFSMNEDGSELKRLTYNGENDYKPAWSHDNKRIAYHTLFNGNYEIFVMDSDGTNQLNLTNHGGYDFEPSWAPDGSRLSFSSDRDKNMEIYIMNSDGSDPMNITNHPSRDFESNFSPGGEKIVFSTDRDVNLEIYEIDIGGGTIKNLTKCKSDDHEPGYSPDGSKIIFTSNRDGNEEVYIMENDGSNAKNLTKNSSYDYNPTWSQDGNYIFFVSNRKGAPKIFKMNKDGTAQIPLSEDLDSYDIQPSGSK
ncbi:MAG: PD40 domain-containing protein [Candidatus Firestonebacteria bacterium]|nr:PD40 domain-containing protein [Candidatus Firestonebacteria bacterium]